MAQSEPAEREPNERLRFSARSVLIAVAMLGATLAGLRLVAASARVLGWMVAAIAIAAMLQPLVALVGRLIPRALAVVLVVVGVLGFVGLVAYGVVHSVVRETHALQRSAPAAARKLEHSKRYGELARDFKLVDRTKRFVNDVPKRLQGGTPTQALRSAATRSVAFVVTGVLSLFFLIYGPRLVRSAVDQVHDPERRSRLERVGQAAYRRTVAYAGGSALMAIAAGLLGYLVARIADVPGPAALGVWLALWDLVPIVGAFIGALPIVLLALVFSTQRAIIVAVVFVAYQVFEGLVLQRHVERKSLHLGPFLTVVGGLVGVEIYGLGGGLVAILLLALGAAVADEVLPA